MTDIRVNGQEVSKHWQESEKCCTEAGSRPFKTEYLIQNWQGCTAVCGYLPEQEASGLERPVKCAEELSSKGGGNIFC